MINTSVPTEHYPFLGVSVSVTEMRCRSMFYTSLGRLLLVDLGEDEDKFDAFMLPITQSFESLGQVLLNSSANYNTGKHYAPSNSDPK